VNSKSLDDDNVDDDDDDDVYQSVSIQGAVSH